MCYVQLPVFSGKVAKIYSLSYSYWFDSYYCFIIIHVGSNNIAMLQSVNQIISFHGDLIHYRKCKTSAQIIFTSILPRLCDFHQTERMVTKVNVELKSLCKRRHISFSNIYRSFTRSVSFCPKRSFTLAFFWNSIT